MTPDQGSSNALEKGIRYSTTVHLGREWNCYVGGVIAIKRGRRTVQAVAPEGIDLRLEGTERVEHLIFQNREEGYTVTGFLVTKNADLPRIVSDNPDYKFSFAREDQGVILTVESDHLFTPELSTGEKTADIAQKLMDMKSRIDQADREEPFI